MQHPSHCCTCHQHNGTGHYLENQLVAKFSPLLFHDAFYYQYFFTSYQSLLLDHEACNKLPIPRFLFWNDRCGFARIVLLGLGGQVHEKLLSVYKIFPHTILSGSFGILLTLVRRLSPCSSAFNSSFQKQILFVPIKLCPLTNGTTLIFLFFFKKGAINRENFCCFLPGGAAWNSQVKVTAAVTQAEKEYRAKISVTKIFTFQIYTRNQFFLGFAKMALKIL